MGQYTYVVVIILTVLLAYFVFKAMVAASAADMASKKSGFSAGATPGLVLFEPNKFSVQNGVGSHAAFMGSASTAQPIGTDPLSAYQSAVMDNYEMKDPCGKDMWLGLSTIRRPDNQTELNVGACYPKDSNVLNPTTKSKFNAVPMPVPRSRKSGFAPAFDPRDPQTACSDMWDLGALQDISEQVMMTNMGPRTGHQEDELEDELKQFN